VPRGMGVGQEGGGLSELIFAVGAGVLRDQLVEDAPAEVELPGLGVVALLGIEGEGQQVVDVAGEEAGALGFFGSFRLRRETLGVERLDVPVEGQAEEALVEAGWQPCRGHWADLSGSEAIRPALAGLVGMLPTGVGTLPAAL